jgi:hypothetical protein
MVSTSLVFSNQAARNLSSAVLGAQTRDRIFIDSGASPVRVWGDLGSVGTKLKSNWTETDEKTFHCGRKDQRGV